MVVVRDSGPGLDSKSLERLFEPFYTTKPQGMGMGLAICRSIMQAHGGRLWATAIAIAAPVFIRPTNGRGVNPPWHERTGRDGICGG